MTDKELQAQLMERVAYTITKLGTGEVRVTRLMDLMAKNYMQAHKEVVPDSSAALLHFVTTTYLWDTEEKIPYIIRQDNLMIGLKAVLAKHEKGE